MLFIPAPLLTVVCQAPVTGHKALQDFIRGFSGNVYKPAYSDWSTLVTTGNTDGYVSDSRVRTLKCTWVANTCL